MPPTFVNFVNIGEMGLFIQAKGVDWVSRAAVQVLDRINAARVDKDEWLSRVRQASDF